MPIPDGGRYTYLSVGLVIASVQAEDAGVYICRATIEELGILEETSIDITVYRMYTVELVSEDLLRG